MEICSQHAACTQLSIAHGERIASLEVKVDNVRDVQAGMVERLEDAANGLRVLAGKIDSAVTVAKSNGCKEDTSSLSRPLSSSLDQAWKHFQQNFALFIVYAGAGLFIWASVKTLFFGEVPPFLRHLLNYIFRASN